MTATDNRRVIYNVLEYSNLCDSSNMTMDEWIRIANDIKVLWLIDSDSDSENYPMKIYTLPYLSFKDKN